MSYELDPELVPAMAAPAARVAEATSPARGDWRAVRAAATAGLAYMATITPPSSGVRTASFSTPASDGQGEIELRWYTTASAAPGPAVVYTHGGGMLAGSVDLYDEVVSWYAAETGVPFLSVELRLAPEATSPVSLAEDVFSGLTWLAGHATDLGVDPSRIAVMAAAARPPAPRSWPVTATCRWPSRSASGHEKIRVCGQLAPGSRSSFLQSCGH